MKREHSPGRDNPDPKKKQDANYYNNLGNEYFASKEFSESERAYSKAIEIDPNNASYWGNLGRSHHSGKNFIEAVNACNRAVEIDPNNALYWGNLGISHYSSRNFIEAVNAYNKAIEIDSTNALAWHSLGNSHHAAGNFIEAVNAYKKAVGIDPNNALTWNNLGRSHHSGKNFIEAVNAYNRAIEIDSTNALTWHSLGNSYHAAGNFIEAINAYKKAVGIDPNNALTWNNLGSSHSSGGNYIEGVDAYNRAVEIDPNNASYWGNLGNAHYMAGDLQEAVNTFTTVLNFEGANDCPKFKLWLSQSKLDYYKSIDVYIKLLIDHKLSVVEIGWLIDLDKSGNSFIPVIARNAYEMEYLTKKLLELNADKHDVYKVIIDFERLIKAADGSEAKHGMIEKIIIPLSKHLLSSNQDNNESSQNKEVFKEKKELFGKLGEILKYYITQVTHIEQFGLSEQMSVCYALAGDYEGMFKNFITTKPVTFIDKKVHSNKTDIASYHLKPGYLALEMASNSLFVQEKFIDALIAYELMISINPWRLGSYVDAEITALRLVKQSKIVELDHNIWETYSTAAYEEVAKDYHLKATALLPIYARCLKEIQKKFFLHEEVTEMIFSYMAPEGETLYTTQAPSIVLEGIRSITAACVDVSGELQITMDEI